ncbi:hypothetical protein D9M71_569770 [compost metagenome]
MARAFCSASMSTKRAPLMRLGTPLKLRLQTSSDRPMASNNCAPRYEVMVEMPIFDRILSRPLVMPLR